MKVRTSEGFHLAEKHRRRNMWMSLGPEAEEDFSKRGLFTPALKLEEPPASADHPVSLTSVSLASPPHPRRPTITAE
jgi:hypothetical protein